MRYLFNLILLLPGLCLMQGCGHSASTADRYTETIFWEDEELYASNYGTEELSDSELVVSEEMDAPAAPESDSAATREEAPVQTQTPTEAIPGDAADTPARPVAKGRLPLRRIGRLHEIFNDSNHYQLEHARRLGINPMTGPGTYYSTRRPLVKIETNSDFVVDELRHSYPYLVPEAARLLHDIGKNFQDSLAARNGGKYRIIVTSVLRTPVTVKRLRRVNGNATQESTHQYGTTFDITYTRFNPAEGKDINSQEDLKNLLGEVLYDLRRQGRCMVKYERKSPCYHITVTQ